MRRDIWSALGVGLCIFAGVAAVGGLGDAESSHQIVRGLAASGAAGLIVGVLIFILYPLEKRVDRAAPRHRRLRSVYFVMVAVWMLLHGPIRTWAGTVGLGGSWAIGVAPSLFAGLAVAIASALAYGFRPLIASVYGAGFSILAEMIQPWLPGYTFDPWDVAAGFVGAGFAVPLLVRWPVPVHTERSPALRTEGNNAEQTVHPDRSEDAAPANGTLDTMTSDRARQIWSWLFVAVVAILCLFNEAFSAGLFLIVLLRPDLLSKKTSDAIESKYRTIALFGACYAAMIGTALLMLTLLLHQPVASWFGLRILFIAFWPFVLIVALNEYRVFPRQPSTHETREAK